jgi:hypothetical protein
MSRVGRFTPACFIRNRGADTLGASLLRLIGLVLIVAALLHVLATGSYAQRAAQAQPNAERRRVALVIGNSNYRNVATLINPGNDARLVARTLRSLGFTLVGGREQIDLDKSHFDRAIENFGDQIQGADVALFYYAGHGVQVRGSNYLIPVDANPTRESDVDFQFVNSETVLHQMKDAKTRLNLIILDACRNNPFGGRGLRAIGGGLAEMKAPEGTLISYATQPGNVASDGDKRDSPFTLALVHQIQQPGSDIFRVFNEVGLEVERETGGEQQPWVSTSPIDGDFYFAGPPPEPSSIVSGVPDPDMVFWQSIEHSRQPADYRAYLNEFPHGRFASLARLRITRYQAVKSESGGTSSPSNPPTASISGRQHASKETTTSNLPTPSAAPTQLASAKVSAPTEAIGTASKPNFIVIGDALEKADADLMVRRFERFGYHPSLSASSEEASRFSLKFGPYSTVQATGARDDLARHWHDLTFHLVVNSSTGPLMDQTTANNALETIRRLGAYPVRVVAHEINDQVKYEVEIGPFVTQEEAMDAGEQLAEKYSGSLNCPWGNCDWQYTWRGSPPKLLCNDPGRRCLPDK